MNTTPYIISLDELETQSRTARHHLLTKLAHMCSLTLCLGAKDVFKYFQRYCKALAPFEKLQRLHALCLALGLLASWHNAASFSPPLASVPV